MKLSKIKDSTFVPAIKLPPHKSYVQGVCSSRHHNADSSLLATCGGKLSLEFYLFRSPLETAAQVSFLCSYRTVRKSTIDHRMNAVQATPLHPREELCHLVLSGDSDGNLHLCVVSERALDRKTTIGSIVQGNGRPVLCIALIRCFDSILIFGGTTGGDIMVWVYPGTLATDLCDGDAGVHHLERINPASPPSPSHVFRAH